MINTPRQSFDGVGLEDPAIPRSQPRPASQPSPDPRSNGHAPASVMSDVRQLLEGSGTLVRQELALIRAEAREQADKYAKALSALAMGAAVAVIGAVVLGIAAGGALSSLFILAGLDPVIAAWLGPAIVGTVVLIIGAVLVSAAKSKLSTPPTLRRTVQEAERTAAWAKEKAQ